MGKLPHNIPSWVDPSREVYFITICCKPRDTNHLAVPSVAESLFESIDFRKQKGLWWPRVLLLMPDHLHGLLSFPASEKSITTIIAQWKEWTAKSMLISWQSDFFEHRLRQNESLREKADYILMNPVRHGLVKKPEEWPFIYFGDRDYASNPQFRGHGRGWTRRAAPSSRRA